VIIAIGAVKNWLCRQVTKPRRRKLIDIPLNTTLAAVIDNSFIICEGCIFEQDMLRVKRDKSQCICRDLACNASNRKDGKNVIFKLVDREGKSED